MIIIGIPVLIIGHSGSGKSTSLRNMPKDKTGIFNVASKPLPFKGKLPNMVNHPSYGVINATLTKNSFKRYVVDDAGFLMAFENFDRSKETGYGKFVDFAKHFYDLLTVIREKTTDDTIVYIIGHIDNDERGRERFRTVGKMLDQQLGVEALCTIVLKAETDGKTHWFTTQNDGYSAVKAPMYMFKEAQIPNDLNEVDKTIRNYYEFKEEK